MAALARRNSPSDHAWNGQPRGVNGGSPSAISDTWPRPAASRCATSGRSSPLSTRASRPWILCRGEGGVDEGADEPRPDRALVVGLVAIRGGARTRSAIARLARRQRSQAERRQQRPPHDVDDAPSAIAADHAYRQSADGQDLIGSQGRVRAPRNVILVHDVEEAAALPRSRNAVEARPRRTRRCRASAVPALRPRSARSPRAPALRPACRSAA